MFRHPVKFKIAEQIALKQGNGEMAMSLLARVYFVVQQRSDILLAKLAATSAWLFITLVFMAVTAAASYYSDKIKRCTGG